MGLKEQADLVRNADFLDRVRQAAIAEARAKAKAGGAGTKRKKMAKRRDVAFMILRGGGAGFINLLSEIVAAEVKGDAGANDSAITDAVAGAWDEISMIVEDDDESE